MKSIHPLTGDNGAAILTVLLLMALLFVLGAAALNQTSSETVISRNDKCYKQNLYASEGGVVEAVTSMARTVEPKKRLQPGHDDTLPWIFSPGEFDPATEPWTDRTTGVSSVYNENGVRFAACFQGIAPGSNMDMGLREHTWLYQIHSKSEHCGGELSITAGYLINY